MKFLKILPFVLSSALIFSSCDDDDNHHVQVPAAVQNSFGQRYPDANAVEWENENYGVGRLLKAEFMENGVEVEAWFNYDGTWVKSERDFRGTLPQAVTDYIAGHYPGFRTDDVNWVETPKGNFYEVELEKGKHEVELSIAEDGTVVFIQDNQQAVPTAVSDSFAERFPGITPSKWETEGWLLKAEFRLQNAEAEAWFSYNGDWVRTETDYTAPLPQAVTDYLNANYPGYKIDDVEWVETPTAEYFKIELDGVKDKDIYLLPDGTVPTL